MCRLAAYVGPPAALSTLLFDPPRSLAEQAVEPREQLSGRVNVDGTGLAWWDGDDPEPLQYRTAKPPWADANLVGLAPRLRSGVQLAAVRSATPGIPVGNVFVHPFVYGTVAGTHNGWIGGFRAETVRPLLARLPDHLFTRFDGMSDALAFFLLAVAALEEHPEDGLAAAVRAAVTAVVEECRRHGHGGTLNLVLADGERVAGVRASYDQPVNTLYTLTDGERWPGATLLASEPLDRDDRWQAVPPYSLVEITRDGVSVSPLPELQEVS